MVLERVERALQNNRDLHLSDRNPKGPPWCGGGVIWLGVIQYPERLALSRSVPEPGAHSILPCFAEEQEEEGKDVTMSV